MPAADRPQVPAQCYADAQYVFLWDEPQRPSAGQGALFEVGPIGPTAQGKARRHAARETAPEVIEWPGGIRPWDPIDEADRNLGFQHTYVSPRRAYEIRQEIEHG